MGELKGHTDAITCMVQSYDGNFLFTGSDDKSIIIWDIYSKSHLVTLENAHTQVIRCLLIMEDIGNLVSCAYDGVIKVWKYEENKVIAKFEKKERLRCMTYIASDRNLIVGTDDGNILYYDL